MSLSFATSVTVNNHRVRLVTQRARRRRPKERRISVMTWPVLVSYRRRFEVLGGKSELDYEVARQVLGRHRPYDPGVGAADERLPIGRSHYADVIESFLANVTRCRIAEAALSFIMLLRFGTGFLPHKAETSSHAPTPGRESPSSVISQGFGLPAR